MSNILLLRGFNNYHKRTILKYSTLEDYQDNSASFLNYSSINFNPNDGIVTEQIVGNDAQKENNKILSFDDAGAPDYLVVYETDTDNNATITSRWFIMEAVKTTAGQFRLALKRDVIADHLDWLLNTDCLIEKGQIMDGFSPFIFNNEAMTYNQIKKKEVPLYDSTGCAWIVGYIAKNYDQIKNVSGSITNATGADFIDMEDTPWGNLTATQISDGITFRTVESINLFPAVSIGTNLQGPVLLSRCALINENGNYSSYYNYGLYYYLSAYGEPVTWSPSYDTINGPGLGFYTEALTNNEIARRISNGSSAYNCYNVYPSGRASTIGSSQDVARRFLEELGGGNIAQLLTELQYASSYNFQGTQYVQSFNGKQVRVEVSPGIYKFYTIQINSMVNNIGGSLNSDISSSLKADIRNALLRAVRSLDSNGTPAITWTATGTNVYVSPVYSDFEVVFREMPATLTVDVTIPNISNRWGCNDQLFDMFCIPYGEMTITDDITAGGTPQDIKTRADAALAAARAMAIELGSNLYDLQILPYCPIKEIREAYVQSTDCKVEEGGELIDVTPYVITSGTYEIDSDDTGRYGSYYRITDHNSSNVLNYVFWATESHGTFDLNIISTLNKYYQYNTEVNNEIIRKKISNESEIFRLCSPNYNGVFEYSASKNNDIVTYTEVTRDGETYDSPAFSHINVDYTYRPGNPYIHLNPIFRGEDQGAIYGQDWNDVRGLICGGDFSLGYIVDAFRSYQIQNANFQNIFDRQIKNIDFNNALAKEQTQYASIMSALGLPIAGATTGALTGAKAGGVYGAIAGGIVGGAGGIGGGIAGYTLNMDWLERQQQETRSYAVDMYNYGLGNIKALPYSISRTDCLAENTRLVPFLEVYESTEREVENLINVLKYNGMTVMTIDKPKNFIGPVTSDTFAQVAVSAHSSYCYYIKAKLIMNADTPLADDFHVMDAIYAELDKGVYLQGYEEE